MDPPSTVKNVTISSLFENVGSFEGRLKQSIASQVSRYAPFISLIDTDIKDEGENLIRVTIRYEIPSLNTEDELSVGAKNDTSTGGPKFLV